MAETIDHPAHYGGAENAYEAIKVIDAWDLGFCLGNAVKCICRHGKKMTTKTPLDDVIAARLSAIEDLKKAQWYLQHEIDKLSA